LRTDPEVGFDGRYGGKSFGIDAEALGSPANFSCNTTFGGNTAF